MRLRSLRLRRRALRRGVLPRDVQSALQRALHQRGGVRGRLGGRFGARAVEIRLVVPLDDCRHRHGGVIHNGHVERNRSIPIRRRRRRRFSRRLRFRPPRALLVLQQALRPLGFVPGVHEVHARAPGLLERRSSSPGALLRGGRGRRRRGLRRRRLGARRLDLALRGAERLRVY